MSKTKYYWKVVRVSNGKYLSISTNYDSQIEYKMGRTSYPKIGKLFVFDTRQHARNFIKEMNRVSLSNRIVYKYLILKVKVNKNITRLFVRTYSNPSLCSLNLFWNNLHEHDINYYYSHLTVPKGTFGADYVKVISKA